MSVENAELFTLTKDVTLPAMPTLSEMMRQVHGRDRWPPRPPRRPRRKRGLDRGEPVRRPFTEDDWRRRAVAVVLVPVALEPWRVEAG